MKVLDASALIAMLFDEPGGELVSRLLEEDDCALSTVNFSEIIGRFVRDGHDPSEVASKLSALPAVLVDFDRDIARTAAAMIPKTHHLGLSIGDRACLATAMTRSAAAVTADRAWALIDLQVTIELIRH